MSSSSRHRPPSLPSTTSLSHVASIRSTRRPPPPHIAVVTAPPWARDEPPSPTSQSPPPQEQPHEIDAPQPRPSDAASSYSYLSQADQRWWSFTLPRTTRAYLTPKSDRRHFRDFLPTSASLQPSTFYRRSEKEKEKEPEAPTPRPNIDQLSVPLPDPALPLTKNQTNTPGWDTPWTPRQAAQGPPHWRDTENRSYFNQSSIPSEEAESLTLWQRRRKKIRRYILNNPYVPLLFRFINIAFTTSALGIAIKIRNLEMANHAMGAVGSSPTVVIIFAPLTLLHVMAAIYLEYFGRPVGLWQTSVKLAHTLSEVLFICAWSAALSLSFDNFFTSLIPCSSPSNIAWYNELDRPHGSLPSFEGSAGDRICDDQLVLICLVGVGLIAYCSNLIISLFRIFEKVKYLPPQQRT